MDKSQVRTYRHMGTTYGFDVDYHYDFNGQRCHSTHYSSYDQKSSYSNCQLLTERYPIGSTVTAYVNPAAPNYALINREDVFEDMNQQLFMLFVVILVVGYQTLRGATAVDIYNGKCCNSIEEVRKAQAFMED